MRPLSLLVAALLAIPSRVSADGPETSTEPRDLVATARAAGTFGTLLAALETAGLLETLAGKGPFTVFAPTDAAFRKLPSGALEALLLPAGRDHLKEILAYHVVARRIASSELAGLGSVVTLEGSALALGTRVGGAQVTQPDLGCTNGVIHGIDQVLSPPTAVAKPAASGAGAALLRAALERGAVLGNADQADACLAVYEDAATALLRLPDDAAGPFARAGITRARRALPADARSRASALRQAFDRILEDDAFAAKVEAPMPAGFPAPGPVGRVVVKSYPSYRTARARGRGAFGSLFGNIQKNGIEMTAPVEMSMDDGLGEVAMGFLYGSPSLGTAGKDGVVEVVDVGPMTVLSIGLRGDADAETLALARGALEARLTAQGWTRAGDWRRLAYNSPFVPPAQRFSELQVPVRK